MTLPIQTTAKSCMNTQHHSQAGYPLKKSAAHHLHTPLKISSVLWKPNQSFT